MQKPTIKFASSDKAYERMTDDEKAKVHEYVTEYIPVNKKTVEFVERIYEHFMQRGYAAGEISCAVTREIKDFGDSYRYKRINVKDTGCVKVPYLDAWCDWFDTYQKLLSVDYNKIDNSRGAEIARIAEAAQNRQAKPSQPAKPVTSGEDAERIAATKAKLDAREKLVAEWIEANGSDRLKLAYKNNVPYTKVFVREWVETVFDTENLYIEMKGDDISEEDLDYTPALEHLELFDDRIKKNNELPDGGLFDVELSLTETECSEHYTLNGLAVAYHVSDGQGNTYYVYEMLERSNH